MHYPLDQNPYHNQVDNAMTAYLFREGVLFPILTIGVGFNSWNLSIRIRYELLLKVLGYEFLPWSLPSLALFLNLFLAYERGPRKYYVRFVVLRTILNKNYD